MTSPAIQEPHVRLYDLVVEVPRRDSRGRGWKRQ